MNLCQREAYRLIVASMDDFLLFHNRLHKTDAKFVAGKLTNEERRRIEVGMVSFRNYALLSLLCLKTLATTYDDLRRGTEELATCEDLQLEQLDHADDPTWKRKKPMHNWYCLFKEELVVNAMYFERYGRAAVDEIKTVARNRLKGEPTYGPDDEKRKTVVGGDRLVERRVQCSAKIHPSKQSACQYDVSMVEKWDDSPYVKRSLAFSKDVYTKIEGHRDMKLFERLQGRHKNNDNTTSWCHARIQARREEYSAMEQLDVEIYWAQEVVIPFPCFFDFHLPHSR